MAELAVLAAGAAAGGGTAAATGATTAAIIGAGVTTAGTALSAYQGAQAAKAQGKVLQQQAGLEKAAARREEAIIREKNRRLLATQQAKFAKAGVTQAGTPTSLLTATAERGEGDILATRFGGEAAKRRKLGEARLAKGQAKSEYMSGATKIGKTLLSI